MLPRLLLRLLVLGTTALVSVAFVVQNMSRTTGLSLNLGFAAWRLADPVAVPVLMGVCFVGGFAVTALFATLRGLRLRARIARLEQEALLAKASARTEDWTRPA